MPSKLDLLRQGQAIEFEPGLSGRLNKEKKTLELSNGRVLNVANDRDYFPVDESQLKMSKQREYAEKGAKGPLGEFLHQYTSQGIPGAISDWPSYLTQSGEDYANRNAANAEVSQRISKESPYISGAATGANIATDLALTRGMSALKAAPILTAGSAGSKILTDPGQVAMDTIMAAGGGWALDKVTGGLGKIAARRGEARALPGKQQAVAEANALQNEEFNAMKQNVKGVNESRLKQHQDDLNTRQNTIIQEKNAYEQRKLQRDSEIVRLKNEAQAENATNMQQFNALKQNVKSTNEARLKQYQDELDLRQNTIIQEKNAYEQRKLQRDSEVIRLKNKAEMEKAQRASTAADSEAEYRAAKEAANQENKRMNEQFARQQEQYKNDVQKLPEMQKQAQKEYSKGVLENSDKIAKAFPEGSRIYSSQLGARDFIEESIEKSGLAGSKTASQSSKILKSLFPEGEILSSKELAARYRALEGAIQNASLEVKEVLNGFKTHMGERIPSILADNMAYNRIMPAFKTSIQREVSSILDKMALTEGGHIPRSQLKAKANFNLKNIFNELTPEEFIQKIRSGELRETLSRKIIDMNDFSGLTVKNPGKLFSGDNYRKVVLDPAKAKIDEFRFYFDTKLDKALANAELKLVALDSDVATKLGARVRKTYGTAEQVAPPVPPNAPTPVPEPGLPAKVGAGNAFQFPPPVEPPTLPQFPGKPSLMPDPNLPAKVSAGLPPPVAPPVMPQIPGKPNLMPDPMAPSPIPSPTLSPAQGMADMAGDFLEKPMLGGGSGIVNNPLVKLGGLKYLLGGAALPAEAAYLGMKGLTSPTAGGAVARASFKQAGIQAIETWAQRYPSYHNGILDNPQERRSLTKEVEDDPEIPLDQKALIQSKINRGKPIQGRL